MPITDYSDITKNEPLYPGQIAYMEDVIVRTGISEESGIILFGSAVCQGTATNGLILPADANSVFRGVAVKTDVFEKRSGYSLDSNEDMGYPTKYELGYLLRGVIGVKVATAVAITDPVYWVHTTNGASVKGLWRNNADTANAVQVTAARWVTPASAGNVARLALNLV